MTTLRTDTLPYRKPELGKHYWIKDNTLPDPFPVVERCFNKADWIMGSPWRPEPWPGVRAPHALLPAELAVVEDWVKSQIGVRALRPQDAPVDGVSGHHRVLRLGPRAGLEADRGGLLLEDGVVMIDLRSDTVTKPSPAMREAMAQAEVGDDVFGEDPTVNRLQDVAARLLGKDASLFVPSGTMGNQLSVRLHTKPGDEIIVEAGAHVVRYESGAAAGLSGVQTRWLPGTRGILEVDE